MTAPYLASPPTRRSPIRLRLKMRRRARASSCAPSLFSERMIGPGIDAEAASPPPFLPLPIGSTTSRYEGPSQSSSGSKMSVIARVQLGEMSEMPTLFDPLKIGDLEVPNRILLAPLTRNRSTGPGRVPNAMMRDYYAQRASAGLILSEAPSVAPAGVGYPHPPGIWSDEQVEGWRNVVEGVHAAGGRIFLQLWHVGRLSDPIYQNGALPVAPSPIAPKGNVSLVRPQRPYVAPRALKAEELADVVEAYRHGAENPERALFDGVEVHGANGYLLG